MLTQGTPCCMFETTVVNCRMMIAGSSFYCKFSPKQSKWNASCKSASAAYVSRCSRPLCGSPKSPNLIKCQKGSSSSSSSSRIDLCRETFQAVTMLGREQAMSIYVGLHSHAKHWTHQAYWQHLLGIVLYTQLLLMLI